MQILIKIAFIFLPLLSWGQISFFKYYAGDGFDFGQGVVQLEDSSYVVTGSSGSFASHSEAFLMRIDSVGNRIWSNHFGGQESEWGRRVLYKKNFGYFLCGHSNSFGSGDYDFYLVKVDENGFEEWEKNYGGNKWERVMDAALTRDTGVVMVGERINGTNNSDMYMVRTDKNGDTLWTKSFVNDGDDIAMTVEAYQDSLFIVGGTRYYADSAQAKAIMYKIHEDGTMLDTIYYTDKAGEFELNDLHIIDDTVQAIGSYRLTPEGEWNYAYFQTYFVGANWQAAWILFNNVSGDWYGDVFTSYGDNSKRYMAFSFEGEGSSYEGGRDVMIQRGTRYMNYETSAGFIASYEPDVNGEFIRTSDGGAVLVGYQQDPVLGSGGGTIFVYKIGPGEVYPVTTNIFGYNNLVKVKEVVASIEVQVYPNPTSGMLKIDVPTQEEYTYAVMDANGRIVGSGSFFGGGTLQLGSLSAGMYMLTVENDSGRAINRIIVE